MIIYYIVILKLPLVFAYTNNLFTITSLSQNISVLSHCGSIPNDPLGSYKQIKDKLNQRNYQTARRGITRNFDNSFNTVSITTANEEDPIHVYEKIIYQTLFGRKKDRIFKEKLTTRDKYRQLLGDDTDFLAQLPMGNIMRAEVFYNKSAVHFPMVEFMHRGHCNLKITKDYMQTALDAFAILLVGTIEDVLRLPDTYVLRSARTISMMMIEHEKLAATWTVVKGSRKPEEVPYDVLEMYRPLFKYLNGREMARLNLSDERIVSFIGTHPDLNRHQVGVVASRYIKLNPNWTQPRYLNIMNNLLCGVPITFMRKIPENTYLQLTHQIFYHINACDSLQRRFYLALMTRTQALGKSYSWSARDVSRLGLLLTEVEGRDLATVNPKAMAGITTEVMLEMAPQKLTYITELQLRYLQMKPLNILARKLTAYQNQRQLRDGVEQEHLPDTLLICTVYIVISYLWQT